MKLRAHLDLAWSNERAQSVQVLQPNLRFLALLLSDRLIDTEIDKRGKRSGLRGLSASQLCACN